MADQPPWIKAGVVLIAIGIVGAVFQINRGDDDGFGCKMTAAGAVVLAEGLTRGRGATQIVATAGAGILAEDACSRAVNAMIEDPEREVEVEIVSGERTSEVTVTGQELEVAAPKPTTCDDWSLLAYQLSCRRGTLGPPIIDFNPRSPTCDDWLPVTVFANACRDGRLGPPSQE